MLDKGNHVYSSETKAYEVKKHTTEVSKHTTYIGMSDFFEPEKSSSTCYVVLNRTYRMIFGIQVI